MAIKGGIGDLGPAKADRPAVGPLCRHRFLFVGHAVFPGGEVAVAAPDLEVGTGFLRGQPLPRLLEFGLGFLEGRPGAARGLARGAAGIETAGPAPLIAVERHAGPLADPDIAAIDRPAAGLVGVAIGAAGEGVVFRTSGEPWRTVMANPLANRI
jgi:hypothetical protein